MPRLPQIRGRYRLREEARESWDYSIGDELVYCLKARKITLDFPIHITKKYFKFRDSWIECHLTFERERNSHYCVIVEFRETEFLWGKWEERIPPYNPGGSVNRNSRVFVDVSKFVETPQKVFTN